MGDRDWVTWAGLAVVGAAAAVMSFAALSDLAHLCGITAVLLGIPVAWLLPATVDVLAAVATRVWLQRRTNPDALAYARRAAWAAIAATVVGNAAHGALVRASVPPEWWAVVVVSAVPAVALGAMVHLAVLVGRGADQPGETPAVEAAPDPWWVLLDQLGPGPWDIAVRRWIERVEPGEQRAEVAPSRDEPDDVLAADLRARAGETGRALSQDQVRERYGVGATRAAKLRRLAELPPDPPALASVPAGAAS